MENKAKRLIVVENFVPIKKIPNINKKGEVLGPKGILTPRKGGYKKRYLRIQAYKKDYYIHRLMLETFVGEQPNGQQSCHNNGNPRDNRIENLRWDTPKNNSYDKIKHGTTGVGQKNVMAKLSDKQTVNIIKIYPLVKTQDLAKYYNVSCSNINQIVSGSTRYNISLKFFYDVNKKVSQLRINQAREKRQL